MTWSPPHKYVSNKLEVIGLEVDWNINFQYCIHGQTKTPTSISKFDNKLKLKVLGGHGCDIIYW